MRRSTFELGLTSLLLLSAACTGRTPLFAHDAAGGNLAMGGVLETGGVRSTGGSGSGGVVVAGGVPASGGTPVRGGAGGMATGGAGGGACSNVTPCGGDVVGTWAVTASCLEVSGMLDTSWFGLSCPSGTVTGALQVAGSWTADARGTLLDWTTTTGTEQLALPASCLELSGTRITCDGMASILWAYDNVSCAAAADGGCHCTASVLQEGGAGLVSPYAVTYGMYKTSGNVLATSDFDAQSEALQYSYCVSGNRMTWTPKDPNTRGTITFQKVPSSQGGQGGQGAGGGGGAGGSGGADAATRGVRGPCDIYAADGGPCVAAHSTVRRLSSMYAGPLYQVRVGGSKSGTGGTLVDIGTLPDGFADGAAQDVACSASPCTIAIIYDQSGHQNDLTHAPSGGQKRTEGYEADAKALPITVGGHGVYGVQIKPGVGYRNSKARGTATGDNAETITLVTSRNYYNEGCCFDYGNGETSNRNDGEGTAEAIYFGNCTIWGKGAGTGPWIMADLENGLWAGDASPYEGNKTVSADWSYVTGIVKGDAAGRNHWSIKVGNGQAGDLLTAFDGPRPSSRYNPMRKEGGILLGIAGDNSNAGQGNFFEGVMTAHYASSTADDAVQANIVAAYAQ